MRDLLFLVHRIPYPPNKGDKIRSWNILRYLAERFRVHVGCFVDDPDDWRHEQTVRDIAASLKCLDLGSTQGKLRAAAYALAGLPLSVGYYRDARMANWVARVTTEFPIDVAFVFSSQLAQYVMPMKRLPRRVIDFVDVDSDKWRQYADRKPWPANWLYGWESRSLLAYEKRVAGEFDAGLFVSPAEAALFRRLAPEAAARTVAMPNGVDTVYFDPRSAGNRPFAPDAQAIVFTGAMDYWPNVDAVEWFARDVLPAIRHQHPAAQFFIVGSNPAPAVAALAGLPGVVVTGRVADVRPYLAHAGVVVAPLRIARGIQNKVLEAMSMARPVVVTPQALEGIPAEPGRHVLFGEDAPALAAAVVAALTRSHSSMGAHMGVQARDFVVERFGWAANLAILDELLRAPDSQA